MKRWDSNISHYKEKNQFCIKSSFIQLSCATEEINYITTYCKRVVLSCFIWQFLPQGREKVIEWDNSKRKKEGQQHEKEKIQGDKELIMACSKRSQGSKRRQITTRSEKSRKEIDIIYSMGHKAGRNATYNEGKHH